MGISAGKMTAFVRIFNDTKVADGAGGFEITPALFWEGPAHLARMPSFRGDVERMTAGAVGSHPILQIHVRYDVQTAELQRTGSGMRCVDVDTNINMSIQFAQDMDGRRETVVITATENLPG
jgi:hypothetical protein